MFRAAIEALPAGTCALLGSVRTARKFFQAGGTAPASKIEAGKLELNPGTVGLAPLIDEVAGTARQLAEQNKNRLIVEAPEKLGQVTVDPMRLRQILLNLLSNACKFTKEGEVKLES